MDLVKSVNSLVVIPICTSYLQADQMPGMSNQQYILFSFRGLFYLVTGTSLILTKECLLKLSFKAFYFNLLFSSFCVSHDFVLLLHLRCSVVCSDIVQQKSSLQQTPLFPCAFSLNNRILFIVNIHFPAQLLKFFSAIFLKKKKKRREEKDLKKLFSLTNALTGHTWLYPR